ncbi:alpha/beta hydrolase [soil metagenome]
MRAMAAVLTTLILIGVAGPLRAEPAVATPASPAAAAAAKVPAFNVRVIGTGPPLILIPGLSCDGSVWDATVEHLKGHYECHVLSLAGFAGSAPIGAPYISQVHNQIVEYVQAKKLVKPVVIGHSLGGTMAFALASGHPDMFGPIIAVDGVPFFSALLNPAATAKTSEPIAKSMQSMMAMADKKTFEASMRAQIGSMITNPEEVKRFGEISAKSDPATVGQAIYEISTIDLRQKIAAIKSPVLLIAALGDAPDDKMRERFLASYRAQLTALPTAKVVAANDCRHFIMLDNPTWFYTTVDEFLGEKSK